MKRLLFFILISFLFFGSAVYSFDKSCINYLNSSSIAADFDRCSELTIELFEKGGKSFEKGNYKEAIKFYDEANSYDTEDANIKFNLGLSHYNLGYQLYLSGNYENAMLSFDSAEFVDFEKYYLYTAMGETQYYLDSSGYNSKVDEHFQKALEIADSQNEIDEVELEIFYLKRLQSAPSNDILSWSQYYLDNMNIPSAWDKVTNNEEVIIAVIDDGMSIHHPDLQNSLWIDSNARYGDSKVIDFVGDGLDNLSTGDHGTMVSGIIAATQNNEEGIIGISENAKIMPLRVFGLDDEVSTEKIIEAMNFAIDNGANVINMSLGQRQFKYSDSYDEVMRRAYENNVIVVIAAGNGDELSLSETGVDLTKNPIAPVCNNGDNDIQFSIGVYSSDSEGYRTNWTNYGNCADFMAPGVDIVSTSIPIYNGNYGDNYNVADGTSFSAPIISGIVALGFNQYGEVPFDIVYDSLAESLVENQVGNMMVDASLYIDNLGENIREYNEENKLVENSPQPVIQIEEMEEVDREINLKDKYKKEFSEKFGTKLGLFPKNTLIDLNSQIHVYLKKDLDEDLTAKLYALQELIDEELFK
ncbi:S8 family serine peptidase [Candidatus Gracilibacteria bacterium]|nr:S8 family serine peptidase [Candidatus Gracilibacteria bacterium]